MSGIDGLNIFGALTTKRGKELTFKNLDTDRNGEISHKEFNRAKQLYKGGDKVDFAGLDKDGNGVITEDEYSAIQENQKLQNVLNGMKAQISSDFSGIDSGFIPLVVDELKEFVLAFASEHSGETDIESLFESELEAKYNEIINGAEFDNMPTRVQSRALDSVYDSQYKDREDLSTSVKQALFEEMEKASESWLKNNLKTENLEEALVEYLTNYMQTSDAEKLADARETFEAAADSYGEMIDKNELKRLKNDAGAFLKEAVSKGIVVKLGTTTVASENAINSALAKYTDGNKLKADMQALMDSLGTTSKEDEIINRETVTAEIENAQTEVAEIRGNLSTSKTNLYNIINEIDNSFDGIENGDLKITSSLYSELKNTYLEKQKQKEECFKEYDKLTAQAKEISDALNEAKNINDINNLKNNLEDLSTKAKVLLNKMADLLIELQSLLSAVTTYALSLSNEKETETIILEPIVRESLAPTPTISFDPIKTTVLPTPTISFDPIKTTILPTPTISFDPIKTTILPTPTISFEPIKTTILPTPTISFEPIKTTVLPTPTISFEPIKTTVLPTPTISFEPIKTTVLPTPTVSVDPTPTKTAEPKPTVTIKPFVFETGSIVSDSNPEKMTKDENDDLVVKPEIKFGEELEVKPTQLKENTITEDIQVERNLDEGITKSLFNRKFE